MIKIINLKKQFTKQTNNKKEKFFAVNDVSIEIKEGKIIGILGPNGAGKTTLLRMIGGILYPTSGSILYDDKTIKDNEIEIKKDMAYLSGNTKLYNTISPYELLKMTLEFYDYKKDYDKRIKEISKLLELDSFLYNRIENLSTGQTQRVGVARCLIHNPKYYILDEATSGLDIISSQIILDFIKDERKKNKGIIYSTHYMEEAENICDYVYLINHGKIIAEGTPTAIKEKTKTTNLRDSFFKIIGGEKYE
ncbi:MAG: ABC transporter ATP-binding protein [Bacilli bacterium]|nr:ABC transporter ATP-binding protein [Bacilli bacterium]